MLAKRIIPCLDIKDNRVVKGINFIGLKDAGDPVENAEIYQKEGADELVFLDITASFQKRKTVVDLVKKVSKVVFMPFTVGGGINSNEDIREILLAGADKVSINTSAVERPKMITEASNIFGSQCIVVAIDAKKKATSHKPQVTSWEVYTHGGRNPTGIDVVSWAKKVESLGAGEILLTSMDCDGTKKGFDLQLTKTISEAVGIPVIASGGAGNLTHFYDLFKETKATAALAASVFHYREIAINQIKQKLNQKGVEVRL
ncbi:MAG: imidazole glycerol phosphate synthase subunit HisF [Candidatus Omnitrophica bacterium]|nr:imidazole glycerol phosphate synthase subunit HisF [Candidatus Omnitrophota bacterium]MCF7892289.1 imidazole glycerol phosphate synthase subunit HisF [Candidatus Omnitrophota bacterium]MCF7897966.1 imidazole glycerol phosphate synthase subunit HisF [Candidatus Omnitrophota bacterium]MCF7909990.1 imidazole glycerol phosphate synthase subunit HisF [Candidatus Omnitrophota bacterium]